jgi:hypothetical protein
VFEQADGAVPCPAEVIAVQLVGQVEDPAEAEMLRNATAAVLYYFKHELGRETITLAEFTLALEQVLRGFGFRMRTAKKTPAESLRIADTDLRRVACASGHGCELVFFPLLREELGRRLGEDPELVRFNGLRGCVKQILGARHWSPRCQQFSDQIVDFLRGAFDRAPKRAGCALVVW